MSDPNSPAAARPLEGLSVGISVSLGEDSASFGYSDEEMNRAIIRLSEALLADGARLVFGHDWRPAGVMSAVARLAVSFDSHTPSKTADRNRLCRITNLVPADRQPELADDLRADLEARGILKIEQVELGEPPAGFPPGREPSKAALSGIALSTLRRRLVERCDARVCIGGKLARYQGFVPGILEEALGSAMHPRHSCVLLSGLMGGASRQILNASRSGAWDDLVQLPLSPAVEEELGAAAGELRKFYAREAPVWLNAEALAKRSGLGGDWERLAEARDIEVVSALVIKALRTRARSVAENEPK